MLWWDLRRIKSRYWETRKAAAEKLGDSRDPRAVKPLIALLSDRNLGVRVEAALSLGRIGHPMAVEALVAALGHEYRSQREAAALALGKIGDLAAVEPLIAALEDGNEDVQTAAALALGMIGLKHAVEPLRSAFKDADESLWAAAARALEIVSKSQPGNENKKTQQGGNDTAAKRSSPGDWLSKSILALTLSFIYCGLGQIYKGQVLKGVSFIVIYALLIMPLFLSSPFPLSVHLLAPILMWLMGMVDAYMDDRIPAERKRRSTWSTLLSILRITAICSAVVPLVIVGLYNIQVTGLEFFSVQVAAFAELGKAKEVCCELLSLGYSARVGYPTPEQQNWYRILVGRFHDEQDARSLGEELRDKHGFSYMIVCYRGTERAYVLDTQPF